MPSRPNPSGLELRASPTHDWKDSAGRKGRDRMTPFTRAAATLAVAAVMALAAAMPAAAGWKGARDRAMTLREHGRAAEAYSTVNAVAGARGHDLFDREFVAGWIALRSLNRPEVALGHFKRMAGAAAALKSEEAAQRAKAKAGYWIGRALKELGRAADARVMFTASMAYSTTFYGQLSSSELKVPVTRERVQHAAGGYPVKDLYWHDSRARKELVLAVIREESRFKQNANSSKDARGMMQVLDGTARGVGKAAGVNVDVGLMRTNADYNIAVGSRYLADQLERYGGNPMLAAAAYNAGPLRADEWIVRFGDPRGSRVDPIDWVESIPFGETRSYVQNVVASYVTYIALKN